MRSPTHDAAGTRPAYLVDAVAMCEARRHSTLLWGTVALAALSVAPVFAHHLERASDSAPGSTNQIGEVCLVALHQMLAPVHTLFHLVLLAGLIYAACDRIVHARRTRRTLSQLEATVPLTGDVWWRAAEDAGVDPSILRIVDGLPNPAFTIGWLRPRVYLASALVGKLTPDELSAVLAHEGAHVTRRDPLRLSAYRFLACVLFWIPAFRRMADDVVDETEVQADDVAAGSAAGVSPLVLASALVSVASWLASTTAYATTASTPRGAVNTRLLPGAVGFTSRDLLERRVRRLAGESAPVESHVTRRSMIVAVAALTLVWASGIVVAHPLAAQRAHAVSTVNARSSGMRTTMMDMDCTRHTGLALFHIFCPEDVTRCPHAR